MTQFFNCEEMVDRRRQLRADQTPTEALLWRSLRRLKIPGLRFRRQYSVGLYVLDFYCPAAKLAIEVDGAVHLDAEVQAYDFDRQRYVEGFGITFLRFMIDQVEHDVALVTKLICAKAIALADLTPNPSPS
jgi:very-short-patch-repair endonuclease